MSGLVAPRSDSWITSGLPGTPRYGLSLLYSARHPGSHQRRLEHLITRIIQPIVWQPYPASTTRGQSGIGDMNPRLFLSPAKPSKLIWGASPAIVIPTATNAILGQGKFSMCPSVVALTQPGHWTIGALVNNVFSIVGSSHRLAVNQMLLQYFINYNLKKVWYISSQPIITSNWHSRASGDGADGNDTTGGSVWTAPFGGGIGRIMNLGFQPVNITAQFYGSAVHPPGASSWGMMVSACCALSQKTETVKSDRRKRSGHWPRLACSCFENYLA